jgi:hypothetical protein
MYLRHREEEVSMTSMIARHKTRSVALLLLGLLLAPAAPAAAQSVLWARQFGSRGSDRAESVAVDAKGNAYVVGWTDGALPGQTSSGGVDAWVRKYDSAGTVLWTRQFGTGSFAAALGVAVDGSGVYVAGVTDNALPGQTNGGGFLDDAFVRKYDSTGAVVWTRQFGTADNDAAGAVAVDGSGNVYVAGNTQGTFPGQLSSGATDAFLQAFDSAGAALWTTQFGSAGFDIADGVAVDAKGNATVVGRTDGAFPGQTVAGGADAFVASFDSAGAVVWTSEFGTTGLDLARHVGLDASGNAYVVGFTEGALAGQTSAGGRDAFVLAYDPSGKILWTRQFGTGADDDAEDLTVDAKGNSFVAGITAGTLPLQSSSGGTDAFVRAYDSAGNDLWTRQFGGKGLDAALGVGRDTSGNAYVAGLTDATLPGQTSAGGRDAFLVKIGFRPPAVQAFIDKACRGLDRFIAEIQSQSGREISARQAAFLIAAANQVKATLDCR